MHATQVAGNEPRYRRSHTLRMTSLQILVIFEALQVIRGHKTIKYDVFLDLLYKSSHELGTPAHENTALKVVGSWCWVRNYHSYTGSLHDLQYPMHNHPSWYID